MLLSKITKYLCLLFYLFQSTSKLKEDEEQNGFIRKFVHLVGGADQRRLLQYLFEESKYDPLERPVKNDSDTLTITMNLAIQQIIDFVSHFQRQSSISYLSSSRMKRMKLFLSVVG